MKSASCSHPAEPCLLPTAMAQSLMLQVLPRSQMVRPACGHVGTIILTVSDTVCIPCGAAIALIPNICPEGQQVLHTEDTDSFQASH